MSNTSQPVRSHISTDVTDYKRIATKAQVDIARFSLLVVPPIWLGAIGTLAIAWGDWHDKFGDNTQSLISLGLFVLWAMTTTALLIVWQRK